MHNVFLLQVFIDYFCPYANVEHHHMNQILTKYVLELLYKLQLLPTKAHQFTPKLLKEIFHLSVCVFLMLLFNAISIIMNWVILPGTEGNKSK